MWLLVSDMMITGEVYEIRWKTVSSRIIAGSIRDVAQEAD